MTSTPYLLAIHRVPLVREKSGELSAGLMRISGNFSLQQADHAFLVEFVELDMPSSSDGAVVKIRVPGLNLVVFDERALHPEQISGFRLAQGIRNGRGCQSQLTVSFFRAIHLGPNFRTKQFFGSLRQSMAHQTG
jgi:hypothetical protein